MMPTIRPPMVVTMASYMPVARTEMSILLPAKAMSWKQVTMPVTVPRKPIMGPREATVATSETRFSRRATSSLPSFSMAAWMSERGRPRRERPLSTMRARGELVLFESERAPSTSPLWMYSRMLFMKRSSLSVLMAWRRAR